MNKKIILLVAVLLIVAIVFVACKGKGDVEETTESTTESTTEATSSKVEIGDVSDEELEIIVPEVYDENAMSGEGVIHVGGDSGEQSGEDSISWSEIVGKNS